MIRRKVTTLLLGVMTFAAPCLATADTNPKKPSQKVAPQILKTTPPNTSSKHSHSLHAYHPHEAKGGAKHSKRNTPGNS